MSKPIAAQVHIGPDYPCWTEPLANGARVQIRPICELDAAAERAFIEGLSTKSMHNRFLGLVAHPTDEFVEQLTDIDYLNDVALVAVTEDTGSERIVGVSRYATDSAQERCECAVVVADDWQNKGLGTALMKHLIDIARLRGLRVMESVDLAENVEMRELARYLGFESRPDPDDPHQVIYTLSLTGAAKA